MSKSKSYSVREHFFGAYVDNGETHIVHWAGAVDVEELERRSKFGVKSFFPVPFSDFLQNSEVLEILKKSNSGFAKEMYEDCQSAYIVAFVKTEENSVQLKISQLTGISSLREAVENAALAEQDKGTWVRLIFVYKESKGIKTQAEDVFFLLSDFPEKNISSPPNKPGWTTNTPKEPGFYWFRGKFARREMKNIIVVQVHRNELPSFMGRYFSFEDFDGEWQFIPHPE